MRITFHRLPVAPSRQAASHCPLMNRTWHHCMWQMRLSSIVDCAHISAQTEIWALGFAVGTFAGPNATYLSAERLMLLMDIADAIITKPGPGPQLSNAQTPVQ